MATIQIILAMLIFSVLHSILARLPVKGWVESWLGERAYLGTYRFAYVVISLVTFAPVLLLLVLNPGQVIWNLGGGWALLFRLLQLGGLIGLAASLLQIDLGRFIGTRQLRAYVTGEPLPLPPEPLITNGVYRLVRHPLYFFSLLVLWFTPSMTSTSLAFVIAATLYFIIGSVFEERTMRKLFGQPYQQYQQQVPWMIPFVK